MTDNPNEMEQSPSDADLRLIEKLERFLHEYEKHLAKHPEESPSNHFKSAARILKRETPEDQIHFDRLSLFVDKNPDFEFNDLYLTDKSIVSENFCLYPFQNLTLDPDGSVRPCCKYNVGTGIWTNISISTPDLDLQQLYNQEYLENLRKEFLNRGKPFGCKACWEEEAAGIKSMRQQLENGGREYQISTLLTHIGTTQPKYLDFKLSSICNLKCRICNSYLSTKWLEEDKSLNTLDEITFNNHKRNAREKFILNQKNLETIRKWAPGIENMQFYGGEPLLQAEHTIILDEIIRTKMSNNIDLWYNTNATICEERFFLKWKNFRSITLNLSIDDIGRRAEWERFPTIWEDVNKNLTKFIELKEKHTVKMDIVQYLTVSMFNVYYLPEILEWNQNNHKFPIMLNMVHYPDYFSIRILPNKAKDLIKAKLESIDRTVDYGIMDGVAGIDNVISYMYSTDPDVDLFKKAINKIKIHDDYRKQDWSVVFPELYEILKEFIDEE